MGRDYKHRGKSKASQGEAPGWQWLLAGLCMGLVVALAVFVYDRRPGGVVDPALQRPTPTPRVEASSDEPEDALEEQDRGFDFYDLLPNFEMVIPEREEAIAPTPGAEPAPPPRPGAYVLQAGSFQNIADAERMKATLALQGFESRIEKVSINSGDRVQEWHRVRIGPFDNTARVDDIRRQLRNANIDVLLIRVGD